MQHIFGLTLRSVGLMSGFWEIGDNWVDLSYLDTAKDPDYDGYCWTDNFMDPTDPKLPCPYCMSVVAKNDSFSTGYQHQNTKSDFGCQNETIPHQYTSSSWLNNCEISNNAGSTCTVCKTGYIMDWRHSQNFNYSRPACLDPSDCSSGKKGYFYKLYYLDNG